MSVNQNVTVTLKLNDQVSNKMPSITGSLIKANLALGALRKTSQAVGKIFTDTVKRGIAFERLGKTLDVVQDKMGITEEALKGMNKELANANLFGAEATETLLTFLQSGLSGATDLQKFTLVAKDYAASIGVSSKQGVQDFTKAIGTLRPDLLDKYRLTLNLVSIYKEYAQRLGKTSSELTAQEKRMAFLNEIYKQHGETVEGVYKETYDTAGKAISSVKDATSALQDELGSALAPAIQKVALLLRDSLQGALEWVIEHRSDIEAWGKSFGEAVGNAIDAVGRFIDFMKNNKEILLSVLAVWTVALLAFNKVLIATAISAIGAWLAVALPVVAVIAALAALGVAIGMIWKHWDSIKEKAIEVWGIITETISTFITTIVEWFANLGITIGEFFTNLWLKIVEVFTSVWEFFVSIFTTIFEFIKSVLAMSLEDWAFFFGFILGKVVAFGVELALAFWNFLSNISQTIIDFVMWAIEAWNNFWTELPSRTEQGVLTIKEQFALFWENLKIKTAEFIQAVKVAWSNFWIAIGNALVTAGAAIVGLAIWLWTTFKNVAVNLWNTLKALFKTVMETDLKDIINKAWEIVSKAWSDFWNGLGEIANGVLGWVTEKVEWLLDKLGKLREKFSAGFKEGSKRAVGGVVTPAKSYLVGERGPEIFTPSTAGRIVPNERMGGEMGGGTSSVNITLNVGMYAGSENEKREIAQELYESLVAIAQGQNKTVAGLLGA